VLATHPKVVAIGECGLDYFRSQSSRSKSNLGEEPAGDGERFDLAGGSLTSEKERERQKQIFEAQIKLAVSEDLPLMIHCRDAHKDVLEILESYKKESGEKLRGNIHFFSGDIDTAKKYFSLGFTISFTGVITFTDDYNDVIRNSPIENILAETDAPYVAPVPHRGQRNEPVYMKEVIKKIAVI